MRKKNFLSGITAKLAMAAVALTTVFTSCEEESFTVAPLETSPASATIVATVYDLETGAILGTQSQEITAGADGTIAATTKTVACPAFASEGYLPVEAATVEIPRLNKGQFALIPVSFYAQKILSAAKNVTVSEDAGSIEISEQANKEAVYGPYDKDTEVEIEYEALVGSEVVNIDEIYSFIETVVPASRALSNDEVISVLKALVNTYNPGIEAKTFTTTKVIKAQTTVTFKPATEIIESVITISATVDGTIFDIPNVQLKKAGKTVVNESVESHAGHDGHNGHDNHGGSDNAGGGAAGK